MSVDGEVLTLSTPDEGINVVLGMLDKGDSDKTGEAMDDALEKELGNIDWEKDGEEARSAKPTKKPAG